MTYHSPSGQTRTPALRVRLTNPSLPSPSLPINKFLTLLLLRLSSTTSDTGEFHNPPASRVFRPEQKKSYLSPSLLSGIRFEQAPHYHEHWEISIYPFFLHPASPHLLLRGDLSIPRVIHFSETQFIVFLVIPFRIIKNLPSALHPIRPRLELKLF